MTPKQFVLSKFPDAFCFQTSEKTKEDSAEFQIFIKGMKGLCGPSLTPRWAWFYAMCNIKNGKIETDA